MLRHATVVPGVIEFIEAVSDDDPPGYFISWERPASLGSRHRRGLRFSLVWLLVTGEEIQLHS